MFIRLTAKLIFYKIKKYLVLNKENYSCCRLSKVVTSKLKFHCALFFLFCFIKEDAVAKFHIMETYTSQADDLYEEANKIEYRDYIPPHTSCYKSLLEFEEIIVKAREMESPARDILKKF